MNKSRSQTMNNQMGYESHLNECLTSRPSCEHFQHFDDGLHVYSTYHNKNKFTNKCNARRFSIACHKRCFEKKSIYYANLYLICNNLCGKNSNLSQITTHFGI